MIRDAGLGRYSRGALLFRQLCQLFYPRRCPFCGQVLGLVPLCRDCEAELKGEICRRNLEHPRPPEGMQAARFAWAAAPYWYEGGIRQSLIWAKYRNRPWVAVQLGCLMAWKMFGVEIQLRGGVEVPRPLDRPLGLCDLVVPVPPSYRDGRSYNVPTLMALPLSRGLGVPVDPDALVRLIAGRPQASLGRQERLVNVIGQFRADAERVSGCRILLVDDVVTTGATAAACAQALTAAGAVSVALVALAAPRGNTTLPADPGIPFDAGGEAEEEPEEDIQDF